MKQTIIEFALDEQGDWVALLACGHRQHVRHNPPWQNRSWVTTENGRQRHIGYQLECKLCDAGGAKATD